MNDHLCRTIVKTWNLVASLSGGLIFAVIFLGSGSEAFATMAVIRTVCTEICFYDNFGHISCETKCESTTVWVNYDAGGSATGDIVDMITGGGGGDSSGGSELDVDNDGWMDCWHSLTGCKLISSELGADFGGTNTQRPDHNGVDVPSDCGTILRSGSSGKVVWMGWQNKNNHDEGGGYMIKVQNPDGSYIVYMHLDAERSENTVRVGQQVAPGQIIGVTGNSGHVSGSNAGCHVHVKKVDAQGNIVHPFEQMNGC